MDFIVNLLSFIVALGILVFVHEFGHFWVARRNGVKVLRFAVGFGKPIYSWMGKDGTEYVIGTIPLGGYVRMLDGGCDPLYIARRVVRMASEDIGNADPRGLEVAMNAWQAYERLGSPEGELVIAQAITYLASAPKSNAVYNAYNQARALVKSSPSFDVPMHLRNAPTELMKDEQYGVEYRYAHDEPEAYAAGECYLPEELANERFYLPVPRGLESKIAAKMDHLRELDEQSPNKRFR